MTEPAAPEQSTNDHPSLSRHWRAKSVFTASGWATAPAAARSPLVHAVKKALAWPSGDDAGDVVVGRDGAAVVDTTVVVADEDGGKPALVAVVGAAVGTRVPGSLEHEETTATTATRPVAARAVVLGRAGPAMSGTLPGLAERTHRVQQ